MFVMECKNLVNPPPPRRNRRAPHRAQQRQPWLLLLLWKEKGKLRGYAWKSGGKVRVAAVFHFHRTSCFLHRRLWSQCPDFIFCALRLQWPSVLVRHETEAERAAAHRSSAYRSLVTSQRCFAPLVPPLSGGQLSEPPGGEFLGLGFGGGVRDNASRRQFSSVAIGCRRFFLRSK